jgi:hypothetical protein
MVLCVCIAITAWRTSRPSSILWPESIIGELGFMRRSRSSKVESSLEDSWALATDPTNAAADQLMGGATEDLCCLHREGINTLSLFMFLQYELVIQWAL